MIACSVCGRNLAAHAWPDELDRVRVTYDRDQIRYYADDPDIGPRPWQVDAYDSRTKHGRHRFPHAVSEDVWNFETWDEAMASIPSFIAHQYGTRPRARTEEN